MGYPRISFTGTVRVDPSTNNNLKCNFKMDGSMEDTWNKKGSGEFSLHNCSVTSAISSNGTRNSDDVVINSSVVSNINQAYAKAVDLDVDDMRSSIFGLTLAIVGKKGNILFQGKVHYMPLVQDMWKRIQCSDNITDSYFSTKAESIIYNIEWPNPIESQALLDVYHASKGGNLSISMSVFAYSEEIEMQNFTLAYVVGTIGILYQSEALHFHGNRLLSNYGIQQPYLPLPETDSCFLAQKGANNPIWMYKTPFRITPYGHGHLITADLSNSISMDLFASLRDLGDLWLGFQSEDKQCIHLIGDPIPYRDSNWGRNGMITDQFINDTIFNILSNSSLLIVRRDSNKVNILVGIASNSSFVRCYDPTMYLQIMLKETPLYIRPMQYYFGRLEYMESMTIELLLTNFGKPAVNQPAYLVPVYAQEGIPDDPPDGVRPLKKIVATNEKGLASFTFTVTKKIPFKRTYGKTLPDSKCNSNSTVFPIRGQVYRFLYGAIGTNDEDTNHISILGFSYYNAPKVPTWINNVEQIFKQYDRLYPVMKGIMRLGNYNDVIQHIPMLKYSLSLDIDHPSYMPVTRDLSPTQKTMILTWLSQKPRPKYGATYWDNPIEESHSLDVELFPERCYQCHHATPLPKHLAAIRRQKSQDQNKFIRPLWGFKRTDRIVKSVGDTQCSLHNLKMQLQKAIEIEFYTIPLYLTALYSIKDGFNEDIGNKIRSIVIQEMTHFLQAANILIAIGGHPVIDSNDTAPSYPAIGLPGGVLPNLHVTLGKLTLKHVSDVFMGLEVPHDTSVNTNHHDYFNDTIGQFYTEVTACISQLGDDIFNQDLVDNEVHFQDVIMVHNTKSAMKAIEIIIEQGEGASPNDPTQGSHYNLAHYYQFEEIICRKRLVEYNGQYCYNGAAIPYIIEGVWPMQPNPSKNSIPPQTNCYIEGKAFHRSYRAVLKQIQKLFDGNPGGLKDAIAIMKSLAVHGRKVMETTLPNSHLTCGPVWDYYWDEY